MKLTELIAKAQSLLAKHGDLEVFDENTYSVVGLSHEENDEDLFPDDWDMPEEFIRIDTSS